MPYREFHYHWEWELQSSPEELWPLVADTNRFNRDTGVPSVENQTTNGTRLTNSRRRLRLFKLGMAVEWEEQPFEWIRPYRFGVVRRYTKGPVAEMRVEARLDELGEGGTKLIYEVWAQPRNLLGSIAIPIQIGLLSKRSFGKIFCRYDQEIKSGESTLYQPSP